jgi:urease accessory protein
MLDVRDPDPVETAPAVQMQRSKGRATVVLSYRSGATRLDDLHQSGCAKAMLPRTHGICPEVVFLNTSGGVTGGDRLSYALSLGARTRAVAATQTAERAYRRSEGVGHIDVALALGAQARLDWLPQETILFDGSHTRRDTQVEMAADATLLWAEILVMGRAAMGEQIDSVGLHDLRRVRRDGKLALIEPLTITPESLQASAGLCGARAISTVAFLTPGAEDALDHIRSVRVDDVQIAASAWDGKLIVRAFAPDALPLKRAVAALISILREGEPLPRVWQV